MNSNNPSITLDNFGLMGDNSNIYYTENINQKKIAGKNVLVPSMLSYKSLDEHTATVTNNVAGSSWYTPVDMVAIDEGSDRYHYIIDDYGSIWCVSRYGSIGQKLYQQTGNSQYPNIKATGSGINDKLLFSNSSLLGAIHRGKATSGGATSLVDSTRDFTAGEFKSENGHNAMAAGMRVYNITQNKIYVIAAGGIAANTLTLTALDGGSGFSASDYYCIVNPSWATFDENQYTYGRQICEYFGYQWILNGDSVAFIDDSGTYTANYRALEKNWIGRTIASNGTLLAIGANNNYKGKIYFYFIGNDNWKNIIQLDSEILAIIPYGDKFIYACGNGLWVTDGYTKSKLCSFPDLPTRQSVYVKPNGMIVMDKYVILNGGSGGLGRDTSGIFLVNLETGELTFSTRYTDTCKGDYDASASFILFDSNTIYYGFGNSSGTSNFVLATFYPETINNDSVLITQPVGLGDQTSIKKIEVDLIQDNSAHDNNLTGTLNVECKLSDCSKTIWSYCQVLEDSASYNIFKVQVQAGLAYPQIGDEVMFRKGLNAYLRRTISDINIVGDIYTITLDVALPSLCKQYELLTITPFNSCGMPVKTITSADKLGILDFTPVFTGDNVMLELIITHTGNSREINIKSIKIYV